MRLKRLYLKAFGPFTDQALDFSSSGPGLHIVYGPNEAGKSSSLRALKTLFFGFEERTADNFLHRNPDLLVGGIIEGKDGGTLEFYRRKKRIADLVDADHNPLEPSRLSRLLPSIGPEVFVSLYGIDHKSLIAGGEEILAQKGEVGKALFAAGSGIMELSTVLEGLEAEAAELFKSRGSKQLINRAVSSYQQQKKISREESLLPGKYQEHEKKKREAEKERLRLEQESAQLSGEIERLSRLQRIIPELAELDDLQKQIEDQGNLPPLPTGFDDRAKLIEQEISSSSKQIARDKERLKALRVRSEAILPDEIVLQHSAAIEDLYQRLDRYRKDGKDRVKLEGERTAQRRDAGLLIESIDSGLSLDDADALRQVHGKSRTIQRLCSRYESLNQREHQARREYKKFKRQREQIQAELSTVPELKDPSGLSSAVEKARKSGDMDGQIDSLGEEIRTAEKVCLQELARIGLWQQELENLQHTSFPLSATVRKFEVDFIELEKRRELIDREYESLTGEVQEAEERRRELLKGEVLPTENDLSEIRKKRQQGWQLIKRAWLDGESSQHLDKEIKTYDPENDLPEAYERQVEAADILADRLKNEAERTAVAASLSLRLENLHPALSDLERQRQQVEQLSIDLKEKWFEAWKGAQVEPLSPAEMREWLEEIDKLRLRMTTISSRVDEKESKSKIRQHLIRSLGEQLAKLGHPVNIDTDQLAPLLREAERILAEIERYNRRRHELSEKDLEIEAEQTRALEELHGAEEEIKRWRIDWDNGLKSLNFNKRISVDEAVDLLKTIDAFLIKLENARAFQSRIEGIDRDRASYEKDLQLVLDRVSVDNGGPGPEQQVLKLYDMLGRSRKDEQRRSQDLAAASELTTDLSSAEQQLITLKEQMSALLLEAGCREYAELAEAIERSRKIQHLSERLSAKQTSIAHLSEGIALESLRTQAAEIDVDTLPGQIASLQRRVEDDLGPRIRDAAELIGAEDRELKLMDGRSRAADAAEQMQYEAAVIARLTDRYQKITLAALILKREIERYRKAHQDPILKRAGIIFNQLTLGAFPELLADVDDLGKPVLAAVKQSGSPIGVEAMSDGTRDQLYLALRLASLHVRLVEEDPMPFIVDDILVNFDDRRSRAALGALAELAGNNQVILFTHHQKIVDQAEKLESAAEIVIHRLLT